MIRIFNSDVLKKAADLNSFFFVFIEIYLQIRSSVRPACTVSHSLRFQYAVQTQ